MFFWQLKEYKQTKDLFNESSESLVPKFANLYLNQNTEIPYNLLRIYFDRTSILDGFTNDFDKNRLSEMNASLIFKFSKIEPDKHSDAKDVLEQYTAIMNSFWEEFKVASDNSDKITQGEKFATSIALKARDALLEIGLSKKESESLIGTTTAMLSTNISNFRYDIVALHSIKEFPDIRVLPLETFSDNSISGLSNLSNSKANSPQENFAKTFIEQFERSNAFKFKKLIE